MDLRRRLRRNLAVTAAVTLAAVVAGCGSSHAKSAAAASSSTTAPPSSADSPSTIAIPATIKSSGVLAIGTTDVYPPYGFKQGNNLVGYEVDIGSAIAKRLGLKPQFTLTQFAGLVTGVASGKFTIAMDGISDTTAREAQVTFVDYEKSAKTLLVSPQFTGNLSSELDACGLQFVGVVGSSSVTVAQSIDALCKKNGKPSISLTSLQAGSDAYLALESGRAQVDASDYASAAYEVSQSAGKLHMAPFQFDDTPLGLVLAKDDTAMQQAVLAALKQLYADGTMGSIFKKWGVSEAALSTVGINLATTQPGLFPTSNG